MYLSYDRRQVTFPRTSPIRILHYNPPTITLGDDKHSLQARGWGILDLFENNSRIRRIALFVPDLGSVTLISIKRHTSFIGCAFHAEANYATLAYPHHLCTIKNGIEYTIPIRSISSTKSQTPILFDETTNKRCDSNSTQHQLIQQDLTSYLPKESINSLATTISFTPTSPQSPIPHPSPSSAVTFDIPCPITTSIPSGLSITKQLAFHITCPETFTPVYSSPSPNMSTTFTNSIFGTFFTITNNTSSPLLLDPSINIGTLHFTHNNIPLRRPHNLNIDKHECFVSQMMNSYSSSKRNGVAKSLIIPHRNPTLNPCEIASLRHRNKTPSPLPERAGDLYHCDIGFGPTRAIGGASYCLTLVDAKSRHTFIYPLNNLTTDLVSQFQQFITDVEGMCNEIRTDFDQQIIGGKVKEYLLKEQIKLSAAPPRHQHKSGLVERKYQTILKMTRNWLTSSLLPSNYWWLASYEKSRRCFQSPPNLPHQQSNTDNTI